MRPVTIRPYGDSALLVTFGEQIDPAVNRRVLAAAAAVREAGQVAAPWRVAVPAYASLLVEYDALHIDVDSATNELHNVLAEAESSTATTPEDALPVIEIPVRYGGADGADLDAVAESCGLTPAQVIEAHSSVLYRAYMLGFAPGFAYLGELPAKLELPRRDTPRQRVPAGSVAIAGRQTAVYPQVTPGGWHLIGRTDLTLWDASREPPALITAGASIQFLPRA